MKRLALAPSPRLKDRITIAAPCPASWEQMQGDDRVRFCGQCSKNVFNLSAMTADEADDLLRRTEDRVCVRLYQRKDGTVLTSDCPVGLAERAFRRARGAALAACALVVSLLGGAGLSLRTAPSSGPMVIERGLIAEEVPTMGEPAPIEEVRPVREERRVLMGRPSMPR